MSRGNHESQTMNQMYGFEGEVKAKYTSQMSEFFTEVYNWLPLAHCINRRVLVMHGGLFSEDNVSLNDIRNIERNRQPPEDGKKKKSRLVSYSEIIIALFFYRFDVRFIMV